MKKVVKDKRQNNIEIPLRDLKVIIGDEWGIFEDKIIGNCYCGRCDSNYDSTIVNFTITLNDINDIVLKGFCKKCGSSIGRYVETGEVEKHIEPIEVLRERYAKN